MRAAAETWAGRCGGRRAGSQQVELSPLSCLPTQGGPRAAEFVTRIQEPVANLQRRPRELGRE